MRRNKTLAAALLGAALLFPSCASARKAAGTASQSETGDIAVPAVASSVVDSIVNRYSDWGSVELNGKLSMQGLPLSPTVRIYMKKGTDLMISARAPFVGEAFRVDITGDSVLMINKLNKTYCHESLSALRSLYPGAVSDIQSLLLGRIVIPGVGELSRRNATKVSIAPDGEGSWIVEPDLGALPVNAVMGYFVYPDGELQSFAAAPDENTILAIGYRWKDRRLQTLSLDFDRNGKTRTADIEFAAPKWGASPMAPAKISDKMRRTGLKDFVNSVGVKL